MDTLLNRIFQAVDYKQGDDIVIIDLRGFSPFVDYFLIATARNERMAGAIVDEIEKVAIESGAKVIGIDKPKDSGWFLIDAGSVVCHLFTKEKRDYYNLEGLWKDLPQIEMPKTTNF